MFYTRGHFFPKKGEADEVFFSEFITEKIIGADDGAGGACGAAADAAARFDLFADDDFETDGLVEFFQHGDEGGARGVLGGVFWQGESVLTGDDDTGFVEPSDLHNIIRL